MCGAIPPLPNTPSWRGAQFKKSIGTTLPLPFYVTTFMFSVSYVKHHNGMTIHLSKPDQKLSEGTRHEQIDSRFRLTRTFHLLSKTIKTFSSC
jgi:hypothetical protein